MKKLLLTTAIIATVSTGANATKFTDSFNDYTTNQPIAYGGKGGKGGDANSNSESGVYRSGNSSIDNKIQNKNSNRLKQRQEQLQTQQLKNKNNINNKVYNGGNDLNNENINTNEGNNADIDIVEQHNYRRIPANTAIAPDLTSGIDTCMGSASLGASAVTFSASLGKTYIDENCVKLKQAKFFKSLNMNDTAVALFCDDKNVATALINTGYNVCKNYEVTQEVAYNSSNNCEYPTQTGCGGRR